MPDKRVSVAERLAGEKFAQADFEQSGGAIRMGGITNLKFEAVGEVTHPEMADGRPGEATLRAMGGRHGFRLQSPEAEAEAERNGAAEGYPDEAAASAYADDEGFPTPTLLDLIDQSNKLADEQRRIATQMYKMTRGL
jgi:hypothetical protein